MIIKGRKGKTGAKTRARTEDDNTLFNTDFLFSTIAIGEGPIYRITPNGPQDIEINDSSIDDLLLSNGTIDPEKFFYEGRSGTINQPRMIGFGGDIQRHNNLSNPVLLTSGNVPITIAQTETEQIENTAGEGPDYFTRYKNVYTTTSVSDGIRTIVNQRTSTGPWTSLIFTFTISALQKFISADNHITSNKLRIIIRIYDIASDEIIADREVIIQGKTDTKYRFQEEINIPEEHISNNGYRFEIRKTSWDSSDDLSSTSDDKYESDIYFYSWSEVLNDDYSYPRTAIIGYLLKSFNKYTGSVPTITANIKGLIIKVPSNYNQPILADGQIDWRQLECGESNYTNYGYRLQNPGINTIQYSANPVIYSGVWDGTFVNSYTQNPVWIIYDLLTNKTYGLGIQEENIDKYAFYRVAQYCDACDFTTGQFKGVDAISDGSFRYKPRTQYKEVTERLYGLPEGTAVKERRFITDITISDSSQSMDVINRITSTFRGILFYANGKITLNVDMPDNIPVAAFNQSNIKKDSLRIFGTKESDIITGIDVTYIEPFKHFQREVVRIDDPDALRDRNEIENISKVELAGVTRRSQAMRMGQYIIASSKYLRRQTEFITGTEADTLIVGEIISVATDSYGIRYGHSGRVSADTSTTNIVLEHFTSPTIPTDLLTENDNVGIKITNKNNDKSEFYVVSAISFSTDGKAVSGNDLITVTVDRKYNFDTGAFESISSLTANEGDLWALGPIDINNFYRAKVDKLFKITQLSKSDDNMNTVTAVEYIPEVYTDSDKAINYTPVQYAQSFTLNKAPPAPNLVLKPQVRVAEDGSIKHDIIVQLSTDTTGYEQIFEPELELAIPEDTFYFEEQ